MERESNHYSISPGVVHSVPPDVQAALRGDTAVLSRWEGLTALARNEWLCWIEQAKKPLTRTTRIGRLCTELMQGVRRPCCWPGCPHRPHTGKEG
jgi:uncharacterized protein YdeI (YjbR/CyaY-like superfamily)